MRRVVKIFLFLGIFIVVGGAILLGVGIATHAFNDGREFKEVTHEVTEDFSNIDLSIITSNVKLEKSTDGKNKVLCTEHEKITFDVKVEDDTLKIEEKEHYHWYEKIFVFSFDRNRKFVLYLTESNYNKLKINIVTGDLEFSDYSFNELKINIVTGHIKLTNVVITNELSTNITTGSNTLTNVITNNLSLKAVTGTTKLKDVVVANKLDYKATTGDLNFEALDAKDINVEVVTGDILGTITEKHNFDIKITTGKRNVCHDENGNPFKIKIVTGDVNITLV